MEESRGGRGGGSGPVLATETGIVNGLRSARPISHGLQDRGPVPHDLLADECICLSGRREHLNGWAARESRGEEFTKRRSIQ